MRHSGDHSHEVGIAPGGRAGWDVIGVSRERSGTDFLEADVGNRRIHQRDGRYTASSVITRREAISRQEGG